MPGFSPYKELTQNKLYVQLQVHPPLVLIIQRQPKWEGQEGSATFPLSLWQPPPPRPRLDPATHRAGSGSERLAPGPRHSRFCIQEGNQSCWLVTGAQITSS